MMPSSPVIRLRAYLKTIRSLPPRADAQPEFEIVLRTDVTVESLRLPMLTGAAVDIGVLPAGPTVVRVHAGP